MMDWKHFANWWKVFVSVEIALIYFVGPLFGTHYAVLDLIGIGLFQYGLFFPVDASLVINSIKGITGNNVSLPVQSPETKTSEAP